MFVLEVEIKKEFDHQYMIIKGEQEEDYAVQMLSNNQIEGLLNMTVQLIDNEKYYYYDITSLQTLKESFEKNKLMKEQIRKILRGILNAIQESQAYLLIEEDFVLEPLYIYLSFPTLHIKLCYKKGYQQPLEKQLIQLLEYMMNMVDYEDNTSVKYIYHLYQVVREQGCTLQLFKQLLEDFPNKEVKTEGVVLKESRSVQNSIETFTESVAASQKDSPSCGNIKKKYCNTKSIFYSGCILILTGVFILFLNKSNFFLQRQTQTIDWIKTIVVLMVFVLMDGYIITNLLCNCRKMKDGEEIDDSKQEQAKANSLVTVSVEHICEENKTHSLGYQKRKDNLENTVISEDATIVVSEKRERNYPKIIHKLVPVNQLIYKEIEIIEFPFFIGKLKRNTNQTIESNTVSRVHGKLDKIGQTVFITDLNSTNGTYLNGVRIQANQKVPIYIGDELAFADVKYHFVYSYLTLH